MSARTLCQGFMRKWNWGKANNAGLTNRRTSALPPFGPWGIEKALKEKKEVKRNRLEKKMKSRTGAFLLFLCPCSLRPSRPLSFMVSDYHSVSLSVCERRHSGTDHQHEEPGPPLRQSPPLLPVSGLGSPLRAVQQEGGQHVG